MLPLSDAECKGDVCGHSVRSTDAGIDAESLESENHSHGRQQLASFVTQLNGWCVIFSGLNAGELGASGVTLVLDARPRQA